MTRDVIKAWGHASRYYAAAEALHAKPPPPDKAAARLAEALEKSSPGIQQAVERTVKQWNNKRLLEKQSGPYKAHLTWVKNDEEGGEIMRVAMIECRSQGMTEAAKFAEAVARYRKAIPKRSRPQPLFEEDGLGF